jgi:conjugal transfer pilus assembly protein TraU
MRILLTIIFVAMTSTTMAEEAVKASCENANIISQKLITDICWACTMPIRLSGAKISMPKKTKDKAGNEHALNAKKENYDADVPEEATDKNICACDDDLGVPHPGVTSSMWEPARLIEFQTTPGCSAVLNGTVFPFDPLFRGTQPTVDVEGLATQKFSHYHYYAFPLLAMLDIFTNRGCVDDGYLDLDLMYLSEVDPTWNSSILAFFVSPESAIVANPIAVAACSADAISSTLGKPLQSMWWCAGTWGTIYPLSGHQYSNSGVAEATSLLSAKVLAALHRRGLAKQTMGDEAICEGKVSLRLLKDQYKFTVLHPLPETETAHVMGESVFTWGLGRTLPTKDNLIYTIWRYNDCCNHTGPSK